MNFVFLCFRIAFQEPRVPFWMVFLRVFLLNGCYPSFRTSFVLLRFFSFFFRRAYRRFSAEQRFLKNSPQSSLIWSKPLYSSFRNNLGSPIFQYLLGRSWHNTFLKYFSTSISRTLWNIRRYPLFRNNLESDVSLLRCTCSLVLAGFVPPNEEFIRKNQNNIFYYFIIFYWLLY